MKTILTIIFVFISINHESSGEVKSLSPEDLFVYTERNVTSQQESPEFPEITKNLQNLNSSLEQLDMNLEKLSKTYKNK